MKKWKKVCSECGSEDITFDTISRWNKHTQDYELVDFFDVVYCLDCSDDVNTRDILMPEVPINTSVL